MFGVIVEILRYVDDWQPGWVECRLIDVRGQEWSFVEKVPVVTTDLLDASSDYPTRGVVACQVVNRRKEDSREVVTIDTEFPWGVESTTGDTRFHVMPEQLVDFD